VLPGIEDAELRGRARRVAELAREAGLDAVLAWSRGGGTVERCANVLYLADHYNPWPAVPDAPGMWSGQGHAGVLVTAEGERVLIANVAAQERAGARCEDVVEDPRIDRALATALARHGLSRGRVGLAADGSLPFDLFQRFQAAVPQVRWAAADALLLEVRRIKSPAEQVLIREAVAAGDAMMTAMLGAVAPGVPAADVHRAGWTAGLERGVALYDAPSASGPAPAAFAPAALPAWPDRVLEAGDLWRADLYGSRRGYLFDLARTTVVGGAPTPVQAEILEAATAIVEAVVAGLAPGVTCAQAHALGDAATAQHAPWVRREDPHDYPHYGHTIGLGWEDLWLWPGEPTPLAAGMHVAVETTVGRPGAGFAMFEQDVLVTAGGAELTSRCEPRPWRQVEVSDR